MKEVIKYYQLLVVSKFIYIEFLLSLIIRKNFAINAVNLDKVAIIKLLCQYGLIVYKL